jgi:murein DD-endopeptidase MepM/ murein hydrolase activator NlpD
VLLSGITICILLPFISLPVAKETILQKPFIELESRISTDNALNDNSQSEIIEWTEAVAVQTEEKKVNYVAEEKNGSIPPLLIIASAYGVGFCINLIALVLSAFKMFRLLSKGEKRFHEKYTLVLTRKKIVPFSFGKFIALSQTDYLQNPAEIICHEKIHVRKKHSLDMIFIELLILLFWFNPVIWLLKRELRDIHEYEADNGVIQSGIDATKYQLLLIKKVAGARSYAIANSFNHSKIKNRITMMLKKKSTQTARLKTMLFAPLAAVGLLAFAQTQDVLPDNVPDEQKEAVFSGSINELTKETKDYYFPLKKDWKIIKNYGKQKDINGTMRMHNAIDIKGLGRDTVYAFSTGTIQVSESEPYHKYYIVIRHKDSLSSFYSHCSELLVKNDTDVEAGTPIAITGSMGPESEDILHFEVREKGKPINPMNFFRNEQETSPNEPDKRQ